MVDQRSAGRLTGKAANANHCALTSFYIHSRWKLIKIDTQVILGHSDGLRLKRFHHATIHNYEVALIWSCKPEVVLENDNGV
jgi:hypothetical protein